MDDVILIITEGKKPEHDKLEEIKTIFLNKDRNIVFSPDVGNIVNLCKAFQEDPFLDYLSWLKATRKTNAEINSLSSDNIAEIYLFFDYDCQGIVKHGYKNGDLNQFNKELIDLLNFCNEATNPSGKLFISYPMIESLWDIPLNSNFTLCNKNCFIKIADIEKYKQAISEKNKERSLPMNKTLWKKYLSIHLNRFLICMNAKTNDKLTNLSYSYIIDYDLVKLHKIESYLSENQNEVFAINPLPLFLLEIGGPQQLKEFAIDLNQISCNCNYELYNSIFSKILSYL